MAFTILNCKANDGITAATANVPFAIPANAMTGSIAIFCFNANSGTATLLTVPTDCILVRGPDASGSNNETWVYKKILPGTLGSASTDANTTITFVLSSTFRTVGVAAIISGEEDSFPIETTANLASAVTNTVITAASLTAARQNMLILEFLSGRTATTVNTAPTLSAALTHLDYASTNFAGAVNLSMECAYRTALTNVPGSYGGDTATYTNTNTNQETSTIAVVPVLNTLPNNYQYVKVGDGMSTGERVK